MWWSYSRLRFSPLVVAPAPRQSHRAARPIVQESGQPHTVSLRRAWLCDSYSHLAISESDTTHCVSQEGSGTPAWRLQVTVEAMGDSYSSAPKPSHLTSAVVTRATLKKTIPHRRLQTTPLSHVSWGQAPAGCRRCSHTGHVGRGHLQSSGQRLGEPVGQAGWPGGQEQLAAVSSTSTPCLLPSLNRTLN